MHLLLAMVAGTPPRVISFVHDAGDHHLLPSSSHSSSSSQWEEPALAFVRLVVSQIRLGSAAAAAALQGGSSGSSSCLQQSKAIVLRLRSLLRGDAAAAEEEEAVSGYDDHHSSSTWHAWFMLLECIVAVSDQMSHYVAVIGMLIPVHGVAAAVFRRLRRSIIGTNVCHAQMGSNLSGSEILTRILCKQLDHQVIGTLKHPRV